MRLMNDEKYRSTTVRREPTHFSISDTTWFGNETTDHLFVRYPMSPPPLVARLVGIGKYSQFEGLKPEGDVNASNLKDFLEEVEEFKDPDSEPKAVDVKISSPDASKEEVVKMLDDLRKKHDRNKAILFFFSGFIGRSPAGAILCPSDVSRIDLGSGITDQDFIHLFDNIARVRGNNIVIF